MNKFVILLYNKRIDPHISPGALTISRKIPIIPIKSHLKGSKKDTFSPTYNGFINPLNKKYNPEERKKIIIWSVRSHGA